MTNAHVVAGVTEELRVIDHTGRRHNARVVLFNPARDIAVLYVPTLQAPILKFDFTAESQDDAIIAGFPKDKGFTARPARIRVQQTADRARHLPPARGGARGVRDPRRRPARQLRRPAAHPHRRGLRRDLRRRHRPGGHRLRPRPPRRSPPTPRPAVPPPPESTPRSATDPGWQTRVSTTFSARVTGAASCGCVSRRFKARRIAAMAAVGSRPSRRGRGRRDGLGQVHPVRLAASRTRPPGRPRG